MTLRGRKTRIGSTSSMIPDLDNVKRKMHEWTSELSSLRSGDYRMRSVIHKGYPILNDLRILQDVTVSERKKKEIKELIKKANKEMDKARLRA